MLFNSYEFLFVFLPITAMVFWLARIHISLRVAVGWLVLASLVFYAWWNPVYVPLLAGSALVNFQLGIWLADAKRWRLTLLRLGLVWNIGLLAYFKYTDFFLASLNTVAGTQIPLPHIVLPLALSFFTFQKIAYLIDVYRGEVTVRKLGDFLLFVTFFPQLITGPIVHYRDIVPQIGLTPAKGPRAEDIALGLTLFSVGLFKKVLLADGIGVQVNALYQLAGKGEALDLFQSWTMALSYTLQLYFDFSGYSDMATGLARLFGIRLPQNFDSPLKSANMLEFWRRWHMTLSRFLRDYVYFPLGGGRGGLASKCFNMTVTFMVSAIWHGAGWTFVWFGVYQSTVVVINMLWAELRSWLRWGERVWWDHGLAIALNFFVWTGGLVLFRSDSVATALSVWSGMAGLHGAQLPQHWQHALGGLGEHLQAAGVQFAAGSHLLQAQQLLRIALLAVLAFALPNIYAFTARFDPVIRHDKLEVKVPRLAWQPNLLWGLIIGAMALLAACSLSNVSEFLYFQF